MHWTRLVVAVILIPVLYLYVTRLSQVYFFGLVLAVSAVAQAEFYSMYRVRGEMKIAGTVCGIALLSAMYFSRELLPHVLLPAFLVIACLRLAAKRDPSSSLHDIAPAAISLLYIPFSLGFLFFLRNGGPGWIVFLFGSVWASDSLAYYVGKTLGKRRLYPEVSPNKTVAGAVGSLMGGALSGWFLNIAVSGAMSQWESAASGLVIGAATVVGDLVESMFKRDAGVKDSGGIIPGHGGLLDKIDGALYAGPVFFWVSKAFGVIL